MPLSEVKGQGHATLSLRRAFTQDRLHHAYLFYGPEGVGKRLCAQGLAELLLCKSPQVIDDGMYDSCGMCKSCTRIRNVSSSAKDITSPPKGDHPDLHIIEREIIKGKRSSEIKIAQVRVLQKVLSYSAFEGGRRVVYIEEADRMNLSTANALLKTLEEPGAETYFILTTKNSGAVLPTILSRCQRLRFSSLPTHILISLLHHRAELHLNDEECLTIARLSEGSIGRALHYIESGIYQNIPTLLQQVDRDGGLYDLLDSWEVIKQYEHADESEVRLWLQLLRSWYRDILIVQRGGDRHLLTHPQLAKVALYRANILSFERLKWRVKAINDAEVNMFERTGSYRRLILEALIIYLSGFDTALNHPLHF